MKRFTTYLKLCSKQILFAGVLLLLFQSVAGQNIFINRGNKAFEEMAYPEAILNYEKGLKNKFDKGAMLKLADAYRFTNDNDKALPLYAKLVKLNKIPPVTYFYFGQSLLKAGKFDEASTWFARYVETNPSDQRGKHFLSSTKSIDRLFKDSSNIQLSAFPYNSELDDFSPIWYREGILFSSSRGDGDLISSTYEWNDQPFLDIYFAKQKDEKWSFSKPKLLRGTLNTRFHEGTCSWDSLKHIAYFTRNSFSNGKKSPDENGILNLQVYQAEINRMGHWEYAKALPFNNKAWSVGHPAVVPNENALIFASDQPGGYGGTDLYLVRETEEGWQQPENLGPLINTAGNEVFPYVTDDLQLYFSSDGLGGLGGLDIFYSPFNLSGFNPKNLGAPINSSSDDFGFLITPDQTWGMVSSNRPGGKGGDDLYFFEYQKPIWNVIVLDAETRLPIPDAEVKVISYDKAATETSISDAEGKAKLILNQDQKYHLAVEAQQYRSNTKEITTEGQGIAEVRVDTLLLERPALHVVTTILDPATGTPVVNAKVRVIGSELEYETNEKGELNFYYDPYPGYESKSIECKPIEPANYCFRFTDEGFFDFDTLQLVYEWDFGDGHRERGIDVRHCFEGPGTYHVTLNLLEPSGAIFLNQSTYDLEVQPQSGLQIAGPDSITRGKTAYFDASASSLQACNIESYQWTIGEDIHYSGNKISHVFHAPGIYDIKLETGGMGITPAACGQCGIKKVVVLESGWQSNPADSLEEAWYNMEAPAPDFAQTPCQAQEPEDYCYRFEDEGGLASDSLPFSYIWDLGDGAKLEGEVVRHCYERPGIYPIKLTVVDPLTKKQISILSEYELDVKDLRQVYIDSYDTVALGKTFELNALQSDLDGCNINSVWWDFGDNESDPGPVVSYQYFQEGTYRVQMVVSGTTPDGKQACSKCSFKEIVVKKDYKAVYKKPESGKIVTDPPIAAVPNGTVLLEIEKEGFETRRLSFQPDPKEETASPKIELEHETPVVAPQFSETPPSPVRPDGKSNVRVRMNVLAPNDVKQLEDVKLILGDAITGNVLGNYQLPNDGTIYLPLEEDRQYHLTVKRQGYLNDKLLLAPVAEGQADMEIDVELRKIGIGDSWVLKNLYYDYGKSHIRHDGAWELLKLVKFLRLNPEIHVELSSHTDARGSDAFNLNLSEARAQSALEFLKARGISSKQVSAKGYGEQKLTNKCKNGVNCSDTQHQANRRTEITIVGYDGQEPVMANQNPSSPIKNNPREITSPKELTAEKPPQTPNSNQSKSKQRGNFTILLGTFTSKQLPARFVSLGDGQSEIRMLPSGGFYRYYFSYFQTEQEVRAKLMEIKAKGFKNSAVIRLENK